MTDESNGAINAEISENPDVFFLVSGNPEIGFPFPDLHISAHFRLLRDEYSKIAVQARKYSLL